MTTSEHELRRPMRMQRAVFQSIGDDSRPALVARRLTEAVLGGVLRAGQRLPSETELAESFGVSATTVREALGTLRERGLIVTVRGRHGGSYVEESVDPLALARDELAAISLVELRDIGSFHAVIATGAIRFAARRATVPDVERLQARLADLSDDDRGVWRRTLDDLFTEIAALGQSPRLTRELMQRQLELSPFLGLLDADPAARAQQREGIERILEALHAGDEAAAATACEALVRGTNGGLVELRLAMD